MERDETPPDPEAPGRGSMVAASRAARGVVLAAFAAAALLAGVLSIERLSYQHASDGALGDVQRAANLADTILLEDERLTMSAQLAAASGERRWSERYATHLPLIDAAIDQATAMAPPGAAERFDQATRVANDRLVVLEKRALAHVAQGDLLAAQALLNGQEYAHHKQVLSRGSDVFMAEVQARAAERLRALEQRSWWFFGFTLVLAGLALAWLWQRLGQRLGAAERTFEATQREVARLALHDPLTGLDNRRSLALRLASALERARRDHRALALLLLDLDGFKPINDRFGHAAGDAVLVETARRLQAQTRRGEIVARLGGDEFVLVLDPCEAGEDAVRAAQRVAEALAEPVLLPQGPVSVAAGIGIALFPGDADSVDDLLRKADLALYRAKAAGRGQLRFFQPAMDQEVREREALQADLEQAIAAGQIVPHFQPVIDLASGRLAGFEVLARWTHAQRGDVPPARFIPVAEDSGLIDALTWQLMRSALASARDWPAHLTLSVNMAPQQLRDEDIVQRVLAIVDETGFAPQRLEIEITESALFIDLDVARRIVLGLKRHGVRVALDDFGTGYSSLSHLSELPFDKLKIDRSFVRTLHARPQSRSIVSAVVGLGRALGLQITAEGIESHEDAAALKALGCGLGQGFLYARALPAPEAARRACEDELAVAA